VTRVCGASYNKRCDPAQHLQEVEKNPARVRGGQRVTVGNGGATNIGAGNYTLTSGRTGAKAVAVVGAYIVGGVS
jgi:hypothetical protein